MSEVFRGIISNAGLLLALAVIYDLAAGPIPGRRGKASDWVAGLLIGALGMGLMVTPAAFEPGIFFDTRSVLLCVSALFFGWLPTLVAAAMMGMMRLGLGGTGSGVGVGVIVVSAGMGLAWRAWRRPALGEMRWTELYAMGSLVHLVMLGILSLLPGEAGVRVLRGVSVPVMLIYPAATMVLGLLLAGRMRRQAEALRLADSEERYRSLFRNDHTVMMVIDPGTGRVVDANPAAAGFYGWSVEELRGMPMERINTLGPENMRREMERAGQAGGGRFRFRHRVADGGERDVEVFSGPVVLSDRRLLYSIVRDVGVEVREDERKHRMLETLERSRRALLSVVEDHQRTERELRLVRDLAQSTLDAIPAHICVLDGRGTILAVNRAWTEFSRASGGTAWATGVGVNYLEVCRRIPKPREVPVDAVISGIEGILAGGRVAFEAEYAARGGEAWRWFRVRVVGFDGAGSSRAVVMHEDVTGLRQAMDRLGQSEHQFRLAITNSPMPIMLHAEDGEVLALSESWCAITGYTREECSTMGRWTSLAYGRRAVEVLGVIRALFEREGSVAEGDFEIRTRSGGVRVWEFRSANLGRLPDGRRLAISMAMDVTERRQAEAEVRQLGAALERKVAERTAQLEASNRELEAFSYSVSHDLRAPLRAVHGFARILGEDHGERLDDEGRRVLGVITSEAVRMGQLIDDLLRFSRLGRVPLSRSRVDMTAMVREVWEGMVEGIGSRRVEFRLGALPEAWGDPSLLRQVWVNLIGNAVKYTGRREQAEIRVSGGVEGGERFYRVEDNGAGFDMKYAPKLFGVFQRLHAASEFEGTGVGLALVQRIVHRHDGRVSADAVPGQGATFCFTLPGIPDQM